MGTKRGAFLTQRLLAFTRKQDLKLEVVEAPTLAAKWLSCSIGPSIKISTTIPLSLPPMWSVPNQLESALHNHGSPLEMRCQTEERLQSRLGNICFRKNKFRTFRRDGYELTNRSYSASICKGGVLNMCRLPTYAIGVVLFAVSGFGQFAAAADPCTGVDQSLTKQNKTEYATLINKNLDKKVKPGSIEIDAALRSGTWTVIYASSTIADPGYFFFDSSSGAPVFKDVWGGMADDGDGPVLIKWARKLGANKEIASCFSHIVISG